MGLSQGTLALCTHAPRRPSSRPFSSSGMVTPRLALEQLRLKADIAMLKEKLDEIRALEERVDALKAWQAQWEADQKKKTTDPPLPRRSRSDGGSSRRASEEAIDARFLVLGRDKPLPPKK